MGEGTDEKVKITASDLKIYTRLIGFLKPYKKELIIASRTEGQQEAAELAEAINRQHEPIVMTMKDIVGWVRASVQGKVYDTDLEIRKAMKEGGAVWLDERFLIGGRLQHAAMNKIAYENLKSKHSLKSIKNTATLVKASDEDPQEFTKRKTSLFDEMRSMFKQPSDIIGSSM